MIRSLAYLGFRSPNASEWADFGPQVLGAQLVDDGFADNTTRTDNPVRLRIDKAAWRLAIHPGDRDELAYLGWDVGSSGDLVSAVERLAQAGYSVTEGDADLAGERRVGGIAWFTDPFGFRHELTHDQQVTAEDFVPGRPMQGGFVTGDGGMGHVVIMVPDLDQASDFFLGTLGFSHSDDVDMGITVRFLHCNPRHHTLAFSVVPGMVGVHHLMLEVEQADDVGRAYDIVNERSLPIAMTLGRHTNDQMFSFYVRTPSGFEVEYGSGGRRIDTSQPWEPGHYNAPSSWGHQSPAEALMPGILRRIDA